MTDKHHHKTHHAKKYEAHEEDMSDIEDSLFSDTETDEPEVGLIKKSHKSHKSHESHPHASHAHHHTHRKELKLSIPIPDKDLMMKAGVGLVILVLLIFFFYNPFYCSFSWNKDQCSSVDAEEVDDEDVVDEVNVTVGDEDESDVEDSDVDDEGSDVEDDTNVTDGDGEVEGDVVDLSGDITFDFTKLPDITKKEWGWQVEKVYFSVDNQQETFIPKVRVRVYEGSEKGVNLRKDIVKVYPVLDVGKKLISSVEFIAMIGDLDTDAVIVMELKDEGDEPGLAEDKLMKKITHTVKHPIS